MYKNFYMYIVPVRVINRTSEILNNNTFKKTGHLKFPV